jgi:hypothetical protein
MCLGVKFLLAIGVLAAIMPGTAAQADARTGGPGWDPFCSPLALASGEPAARQLGPSLRGPSDDTIGTIDVPTPASKGHAGGVIDVYFHVITSSSGEGNLADSLIREQVRVLNRGFAATGWSFRLVSTDRTANDRWFLLGLGSKEEREAKAALRKGGADDLNIYTARSIGIAGFATFPWEYKSHPLRDGIVVHYRSLPGGNLVLVDDQGNDVGLLDEGDTATHEAGHWMGLYHTFQGGCNTKGDYVSDTPAERSPNYRCDEQRDTCTRDPGLDPVHNFMDYSADACVDRFTPGQDARMDAVFAAFRAGR